VRDPTSYRPVIDILMYHSISDRGGPTAIAPEVFAMQMRAVAKAGVPVVTMDDLAASRSGGGHLPPRSVIITFDDGFQDFADVAWPVMSRHGFRPIVYLPTGFVGRTEGWKGIADPPRMLMRWETIRALGGDGVIFGSHTISHPDLQSLQADVLDDELMLSRNDISARLEREIRHFAPPYGRSSASVRARIARHYETSVGTVLGQASLSDDPINLPRIEMFYFQGEARWHRHLADEGGLYLAGRRALRAVKGAVMRPWMGI
jgi:peptidoglycan/xylan/chitin deacetylase (PgdA/CDA1 family)